MLAGEPPYTGPTAQAIIARVMTERPRSLVLQRHTVSPQLDAVINKALEKLPADRFASAAAFSEALAQPTGFAFTSASPATMHVQKDWRSRAAMPALGLALIMTAAATWAFLVPPPDAPVARYGLALPSAQTLLFNRQVAVAPDASFIAYTGPSPAGTFVPQLWIKPQDREYASPVPGTIGAQSVTFSPDSRWIAFGHIGRDLRKLQIGGGAAITLADSMAGSVAPAWLDDGTIIFVGSGSRRLLRVAEDGGEVTEVWPADSGVIREVTALPGSRGVLFSRCNRAANCTTRDVWALNLKSGRAQQVASGAIAARYLATGHVLYVRADGAAFVIPFDLRGLKSRGSPMPMLDSVAINANVSAQLDVSRAGTMVLFRGGTGMTAQYNFAWVDRSGREESIDMGGPLQMTQLGNGGWALSPDGKRLAIGLSTDANDAVWVKELPSGPLSRVTLDSAVSFRPRWLPGGRELTYVANPNGAGLELRRVAADGTGNASLLMRNERALYEAAVSTDGRWIVARTSGGIGRQGRDIIGFRVGDTTAVPLMANPSADEAAFALSPDGRWIAYESDETGRREVYVRPFPATNTGKWQASTAGGMAPLWARNGRELFFVDGARRMTAVSVAGGAEPNFGERRVLFTLSPDDYLDDNTYYTPFDVGPDGRFIMARRVRSDSEESPLIVVENWFTELRQKVRQR
jgi:serine/threonine-protein kinase